MYTWKLFWVVLLFCDVNAQLNTCITPEGNKGICQNIWECKELTKDLFINKQNSLINFKVLKSVCDFTTVIKICCPIRSNSKNGFLERMKRQDLFMTNENTKCDDKNSNFNSALQDEQMTVEVTTEENIDENIEETTTQITTEELIQENNEPNPIDHQHEFDSNNNNNNVKESEFQVNNNTFIIINMNDNSHFINHGNDSLLDPNLEDANIKLHHNNINNDIINNDNINNDIINNNNNNNNNNKAEQSISMSLFNKILCLILSKNSNDAISVIPNSDEEKISMSTEIEESREESPESFEINEMSDVIDTDVDYNEYDAIWFEEENGDDVDYILLPNPPFCGRNDIHIPVKGEYPWQVLIKEAYVPYIGALCKGTLITREHVITTANCVYNKNIESILIRSQETSTYIPLEIKEILIHEQFTPSRIDDDIALITLTEPVDLEEASPICLKADSHLTKNLTGVVGYAPGYPSNRFQISKSVAKIQTIISPDDCDHELYKLGESLDIDENVICTTGKQDICLGNEGSPLLIRGKASGQIYFYQIGVLSGMNYCNGLMFRPGIFVNIHKYLNWILKNM